jgi:BirA family biotin operon repressor/biotin-[acetyl-CoA-carboxylase] ligase
MPLDKIDTGFIRTHLKTKNIGCNITYRHSVSSTMDVAAEEIVNGAPHGTVVIADTQQKGKGRLDHEWVSPPGGIYLSIIIYPPEKFIPLITMTACLAALDCIKETTTIKPEIKWPNDLQVNGKKVCGILAKSGTLHQDGKFVVIGAGINVAGDLNSYPGVKDIAVSLEGISGKSISRETVICSLLKHFETRYLSLETNGLLWQEFENNLNTIGKKVAVKSGNNIFEGVAEAINAEGNLLIRQDDGELIVISAGDVTINT